MTPSSRRLVGDVGLKTIAIIGMVALFQGAQQQPPAAPPPPAAVPIVRGGPIPPPPPVDPPEPRPGEGVDLAIRVVDAVTGKGLGSVKLEVTRNATPVDRRRWIYSKATDALGEATVASMMPDAYSIAPTLVGYMLAKGATPTITLSAGKKPAPVTFRMWRSSSVDGVVQDQDGNPVVRATVDLLEESWMGGFRTMSRWHVPSVMTDKEGKFAFAAVMPGTYYLRAVPDRGTVQRQLWESPAGKQAAFVDTLFPGVLYLEQAAPVKLAAGANLYNVRIELQTSPYYSLSGRVTGVTPEVRGSELVLIRRAAFDSPLPFIWGIWHSDPFAAGISTSIAADGTFFAPSVPPGPYWAEYTPAGPVFGGTQFLMADRNLEDVRIEVTPGINVTGKVVFDDGTTTQLPGVGRMSVLLANMGVYTQEFEITANGEFTVPGLPAGSYRVDFFNRGPFVVRKVEVNRRTFSGREFELTPLDPVAVITLSRGGATIQGTVDVLEQSKAYPRGMVTVSPLPFRATDGSWRKYLEGNTSFSVEHLDAGRYRVCAWLEEGSEVDRLIGNPQYEQKFRVSCEAINLAADERRAVQLKQITVADFR